jgi:holo-[acyl-carrier protein] synthase
MLELKGGALGVLQKQTPANHKVTLTLTLSDEPPLAQALVIIEAHPL